MRHRKRAIYLTLTTMMVLQWIQAADTKIDSVWHHFPGITVTVHKHQTTLFETAIPVQVIGETRIIQSGITSLEELAQGQPGLTTTTVGPWSQKFVLRGLSDNHVLTLIDGLRLNVLRAYGDHAPLVDVDQIERMEIVRGPASFLYGSDAIAGVINIITRSPYRSDAYVRRIRTTVGLQYASVNKQFSQQAGINGQWNQWSFLIHTNHRKADLLQTPKGKLHNTAFESFGLNSKLAFYPNQQHRFQLTSQISRMNDVGVPINAFATNARFINYNENRSEFLYEWKTDASRFRRMQLQSHYQQGNRQFDARLYHVPNGPLFVNNHLNANRDVETMGGTCHSNWSFWNHTLTTFGVDGFYTSDDTRRSSDPVVVTANDEIKKDPPEDLTPPTPPSCRMGIGLFAEHETSIIRFIDLTAGVRFDQIQSHADATAGTLVETDLDKTDKDVSASAGLLYRFTDNIHITANMGRAFKAPALQQRFFKGTAQIGFLTGNPDLQSEISLNLDLGCKWNFRHWTGEINAFRNDVDSFIVMNLIDPVTNAYQYDNVGKAQLTGGELSTEWRINPVWQFVMNASLVRGKDTNADTNLPQIPADRAMLGVRYYQNNGFWIEVKGHAVAEQNRTAENELTTPAYGLCDLGVGIQLKNTLNYPGEIWLNLNVRNLFDIGYRDHLSSVTWWDAAGRNIIVTMKTEI